MIILDFDGVLIDSVDEVIATAFFAITGWAHFSLSDLPPSYVAHFHANRFHVQPAGDLLPLARWCLKQPPCPAPTILSPNEFRALISETPEPLGPRREKFYAARKILVDRGLTSWLNLNPPYYPLWKALQSIAPERLVIMTNKNRQAVLDLVNHYGLPLLPENIYSGDKGVTKGENLASIRARFGIHGHIFIDDSVLNLRELRHEYSNPEELQLLLATWGYLGPDDREIAAREGFRCSSQEDLIALYEKEA